MAKEPAINMSKAKGRSKTTKPNITKATTRPKPKAKAGIAEIQAPEGTRTKADNENEGDRDLDGKCPDLYAGQWGLLDDEVATLETDAARQAAAKSQGRRTGQ